LSSVISRHAQVRNPGLVLDEIEADSDQADNLPMLDCEQNLIGGCPMLDPACLGDWMFHPKSARQVNLTEAGVPFMGALYRIHLPRIFRLIG
jgi:hypothetical protein